MTFMQTSNDKMTHSLTLLSPCVAHLGFMIDMFSSPNVFLQIEKRMEAVRLVSHNTHKKLVSCLQGQLGTDTEKRQVRMT